MFSLTLYWDGRTDNRRPLSYGRRPDDRAVRQMNTTPLRNLANPRRTTLAHLKDAEALQTAELPEHAVQLPTQTANPRRTILMTAPAAVTAAAE